MRIDKSKIVKKDWQWGHEYYTNSSRYHGVHTYEGKLVWYTETYPGYAGGGACTQSFEDFLKSGPKLDAVPQEIIDEITEIIKNALC